MIIETHSYPRAALIGNPSDGYFGKTIAFVFSNFQARVLLYETPGGSRSSTSYAPTSSTA